MAAKFTCYKCDNDDAMSFKYYYHEGRCIGSLCTRCNSECLEDTVDHECPDIASAAAKLELDDSSASILQGKRTEVANLDYVDDYLAPGDHIMWQRPFGYAHHAIVDGVIGTNVTVIHFAPPPDKTAKGQVLRKSIDVKEEKGAGTLYRVDYSDYVAKINPTKVVLARANALIGQCGYHLLKNNCESFATFCKLGVNYSHQAIWFLKKLKQN